MAQPSKAELEKAIGECRGILNKNPRDPYALFFMSMMHVHLGRLDEAMSWMEKSLAVRSDSPEAWTNYALMLNEKKRLPEAEKALQRALVANPKHAEAHYNLGNLLYARGEKDAAIQSLETAIKIDPKHLFATNNLGNIYRELGQLDKAMEYCHRALAIDPNYTLALNNLGLSLTYAGRFDEAHQVYDRALAINPDYPEAINNKGSTLRLQGHFAESRDLMRRALELRPDYAEAWNNLGNVLKDLGQIDESIPAFRRALALNPSNDMRYNLATVLMTIGDYDEGFRLYEARWDIPQMRHTARKFRQPQWQGEEGNGRILLIHAEQGLGDALQFCRYAPIAAARGWRILLACHPELVRLMHSLDAVDQIVTTGILPDFDMHCPMLSLPLVLGTTVETIPSSPSYLAAEPADIAHWQERIKSAGVADRFKVGVIWAGNPRLHNLESSSVDRRRSVQLDRLAPLFGLAGVQFFSLQKNYSGVIPPEWNLIDWMNDCHDMADTAALVMNLDLVITVDTSLVHLAGALGKPVWMLNRIDTCWRWFLDRTDSPWYPSLRIFRQQQPGNWDPVVKNVVAALQNRVNSPSNA